MLQSYALPFLRYTFGACLTKVFAAIFLDGKNTRYIKGIGNQIIIEDHMFVRMTFFVNMFGINMINFKNNKLR